MRKRRLRRRERSKRKKAIIISTLCLFFMMAAGYAAFQTNISITAKGTIVEKSRVIRSWTEASNEDFHTDFYKENIVTATFLDSSAVPSNAVESWDVSADKKKGVMAWIVTNETDNTKYDLYIGAKDGVIANENSSCMFFDFTGIKSIDFGTNFDTSNVTNMDGMFQECINLTSIDLSSFNTSKVTSMLGLFSMWHHRDSSSALTEINISGLDTKNVTNIRDMFSYNHNLTNIVGLEDMNTTNVENMQGLFYDCKSISNLDLRNWNTTALVDVNQMFAGCSNLENINICSFRTGNVTNMKLMFYNTPKLKHIYVGPNWTTANASTTNMFMASGVSTVTTGQC